MCINQGYDFMKKMSFLDRNDMKPTVSTLNIENIPEENELSEILLLDVIDVNKRIFEDEISSGSDITSHGTPSVDDVYTTPECILPGLTSTNKSSNKRKSRDDFSTSIKKLYGWVNEVVSEPIYNER